MQCPACGEALKAASRGGVDLDECGACAGTWFDRDELRRAKDSADEYLQWLDFDVFDMPSQAFDATEGHRQCPKCSEPMRTGTYMNSGVHIDVCPAGHGAWLDQSEFEAIVGYLEKLVNTMGSGEYARNVISEMREVVTGPEGLRSEVRDFLVVLRLLQMRFAVEHPGLVDKTTELSRRL